MLERSRFTNVPCTKAMVRTLLSCPPEELVALSFCPSEAYSQTPGPNAGKRLEAGE